MTMFDRFKRCSSSTGLFWFHCWHYIEEKFHTRRTPFCNKPRGRWLDKWECCRCKKIAYKEPSYP